MDSEKWKLLNRDYAILGSAALRRSPQLNCHFLIPTPVTAPSWDRPSAGTSKIRQGQQAL